MKIALAQIDTCVGDFAGNRRRMVAAAERAVEQGAELAVFPELAVTGYPPRDLLAEPAFVEAALAATDELARELPAGLPAVVGTIARAGETLPGHPGLWNVAALLGNGRVEALVPKRLLPLYDVFLEPRWFLPGPASPPLEIAGRRVGVLICEDLWDEGYPVHPPAELAAAGAELLVSLSASPYRPGIFARRLAVARQAGLPITCVNALGGNDELLFDGAGFALDRQGRMVARLPAFEEAVVTVDLEHAPPLAEGGPEPAVEEELWQALVRGIRDFACKNGLERVVLGLAGDAGSAALACLAAAAVGPGRVTAVLLPGRAGDPRPLAAARELAASLGIVAAEVELAPLCEAAPALGPESDLEVRLRPLVVAARACHLGGLGLDAVDKTALSRGACAAAGTLAPLGDLTRPQVEALARWIAAHRAPIPPPLLNGTAPAETATAVPGPGLVLKVSEKAYGSGRLLPVAQAWHPPPSRSAPASRSADRGSAPAAATYPPRD